MCKHANFQVFSASIEAGSGLGHEHLHTRPADVLLPIRFAPNVQHSTLLWTLCWVKPILLKWVPQYSQLLSQQKEEACKNYQYCSEFSRVCLPMAVEVYGAQKAEHNFSPLAVMFAVNTSVPKSQAPSKIYTWMNLTLVRSNSRTNNPTFCKYMLLYLQT